MDSGMERLLFLMASRLRNKWRTVLFRTIKDSFAYSTTQLCDLTRSPNGLGWKESETRGKGSDQPLQLHIRELAQFLGLDRSRMPQFGRHFMPSRPGPEPEDLRGDVAV